MNYYGSHESEDDICHYGRLGMKWYRHIYGTAKASGSSKATASAKSKMNDYYHKGVTKMQSLDTRGQRLGNRANSRVKTAALTRFPLREKRKLRRASRLYAKSYKRYNKQNKIARNLLDVYSTVPSSELNSEDVAYVKKSLHSSEKYRNMMLSKAAGAKSNMHVANMDYTNTYGPDYA